MELNKNYTSKAITAVENGEERFLCTEAKKIFGLKLRLKISMLVFVRPKDNYEIFEPIFLNPLLPGDTVEVISGPVILLSDIGPIVSVQLRCNRQGVVNFDAWAEMASLLFSISPTGA